MNELIPWLQELLGPGMQPFMLFITDWAGPLGWWIVLQLVFILGGIRKGLQLTGFATFALITNGWLKWLIAEPRPFLVDDSIVASRATPGFGMPSGHAQGASAVWGGLAWMASRKIWIACFIILLLLTGLSRIYLGVHSPAQVLVGWTLGLLGLWGLVALWPKLSSWCNAQSAANLGWCLAAGTTLVIGINELVHWLIEGFVVPTEWLAQHRKISGDSEAAVSAMGLTSNSGPILIMLAAGFLAIGLLDRVSSVELASTKGRVCAVLLTIMACIGYVFLLGLLINLPAALALAAFAQPLFCVYLSMFLVRRYIERH